MHYSNIIKLFLSFFGCFTLSLLGAQFPSAYNTKGNIPQKPKSIITSQQGIFKNISVRDKDIYLSSSHKSSISGINHLYYQQTIDGIDIYDAVASIHLDSDHQIAHATTSLIDDPKTPKNKKNSIPAVNAISIAADYFKLPKIGLTRALKRSSRDDQQGIFENQSLTRQPMRVQLVYLHENGKMILQWKIMMDLLDKHEQWTVFINAEDGSFTRKEAMFLACQFGPSFEYADCIHPEHHASEKRKTSSSKLTSQDVISMVDNSYKVYAIPLQAPHEGLRSTVVEPWLDAIQSGVNPSPYGWHDLDGVIGADTTVTIGNNVIAIDDLDGDDTGGVAPDGSSSLSFDFPLDTALSPSTYTDAATVNLFYVNNIMHDVSYLYGFDEAAGNFQTNNYDKGGLANDALRAECQDGSRTNNALFFPAIDGSPPRMEMFEWSRSEGGVNLEITSPASVEGSYEAIKAAFGSDTADLSGSIVLADPVNGCDPLSNDLSLNGNIALIDRGDCDFVVKVKEAQNAGSIAVIICNNIPNQDPVTMGGSDPTISIPAVMISYNDCQTLKVEMDNGLATNLFFAPNTDSDLDNGIIAHEYAHGISIRLTGGAQNINCLRNREQMGEGWSDFFTLMLQLKPGDLGPDPASIGTYVLGETPVGDGIRPYPYTTDMSINPSTYGSVNNGLSVHSIGAIWCTMLWDMTWSLIDKHGFEPDIYKSAGGNGIALKLVMEGLKLQACSPGFVDGRDAILLADRLMFAGQNQCEIWQAFSRRGLGYSADQGSSSSTSDGIEAFDLPPSCPLLPCDHEFLSYINMTIPDGTDGQALHTIDIINSSIASGHIVKMTALDSIDISSLEVSLTGQLEINMLPCDNTSTNLSQPQIKK